MKPARSLHRSRSFSANSPPRFLPHGNPIVLPRLSNEVDYEAELVAVIGRGGRHIAVEQALDHIAGYTCGHDVSARDWQQRKPGGQWLLGKSFDTSRRSGQSFVTADEAGDASDLRISLRINGRTMQDSRQPASSYSPSQNSCRTSPACARSHPAM